MKWPFSRRPIPQPLSIIPAPGAVLTLTGPVSTFVELKDTRPRFVDVGPVDVASEKFRRSALVDVIYPEGDEIRIRFADPAVPDMVLRLTEHITFHIVDIDRPDLGQRDIGDFTVRMEPRKS